MKFILMSLHNSLCSIVSRHSVWRTTGTWHFRSLGTKVFSQNFYYHARPTTL